MRDKSHVAHKDKISAPTAHYNFRQKRKSVKKANQRKGKWIVRKVKKIMTKTPNPVFHHEINADETRSANHMKQEMEKKLLMGIRAKSHNVVLNNMRTKIFAKTMKCLKLKHSIIQPQSKKSGRRGN